MTRVPRSFLPLALLVASTAAAAQQPVADAGWNSPRSLELMERAAERRHQAQSDTALANYAADARIFVYFYLDRPDIEQRNLVKTDQVALEVFWRHPNQTKQRIVGWRDEKSLPTNINYHLDHLSVVQENFGDVIVIGDGDEVRDVLHPAAPAAADFYDYRLADSLTLRLPGAEEPVRVYEIQVRPRDESVPAFVGSVFVERRAGDIVRMDFTFTEAAYVDRYLDYINISLDNGLWRGRFWLPNEQRLEVRRRLPQLDVPAGSVIRATVRVQNYRFNEPLADRLFVGPKVVALAPEIRERFEFEEEIHAEVREQGLGEQVELDEIRRQARELVGKAALERGSEALLRIASASDAVRYNRAEGLYLGAGATLFSRPPLDLTASGGWAFGAEHANAALNLTRRWSASEIELSGFLNRPRDIGVGPAASGAMNSLAALFAGRDYADLYYASGGTAEARFDAGPFWTWTVGLRVEEQRSAALEAEESVSGERFRPVHRIHSLADDEALAVALRAGLRRSSPVELGRWWRSEVGLEAGATELQEECGILLAGDPVVSCEAETVRWGKLTGEVRAGRRIDAADAEIELRARGGAGFGTLPVQELFLIGGRGTVPGHPFRDYGGGRFAVLDVAATRSLFDPWLSGRLAAAAGWSDTGGAGDRALRFWPAKPTGAPIGSVRAGFGIFYDILRIDLARGIGEDGFWELIVEIDPQFWDFL